jgi:hypothetical protein
VTILNGARSNRSDWSPYRLEQDEGVDDLRRVERQPQGDDPAGGVADDVCALDADVPQQGAAVLEAMTELGVRRYVRYSASWNSRLPPCSSSQPRSSWACARVLLLRRGDRHGAVAQRIEGQSLHPDRLLWIGAFIRNRSMFF